MKKSISGAIIVSIITVIIVMAFLVITIHAKMLQECDSSGGGMTSYFTCTQINQNFGHQGPSELKIKVQGDDAWAVCGALGVPCPTNPVFPGSKIGDNVFVVSFINGNPYEVKLNKTDVCVTPPSKVIECTRR